MSATSPPKSVLDLYISFTLIALQGFGGVLAIVQREVVDKKKWLSKEDFVEEWAVAQVMPGPNVVNMSLMIGARYFGLRGALAAMAGMLSIPLVIVLLLAVLYTHFAQIAYISGAIRGMSAVAAGLIIAAGFKMAGGLTQSPLGKVGCAIFGAACFISVAVFHISLMTVLLALGLPAYALAFNALKRSESVRIQAQTSAKNAAQIAVQNPAQPPAQSEDKSL